MTPQFYVEIVPFEPEGAEADDAGYRKFGPMPERKANRLDDGININLDHERYFTRVTEAK